MQERLAVFSSDAVNAYGMRMPFAILAGALEHGWCPGQPMFLNHDRHRLEGWTRALGIYLQPGLARLVGSLESADTPQEGALLEEAMHAFLGRKTAAEVEPHRAELESRLRSHLTGGQQPIYAECAALCEPGLAERTFPDLFADVDNDGLVKLTGLRAIDAGVFERDGLLFFASDFLRRSLSRHNTLNAPLLERLQNLAADPTLTVRIRLDRDMVGLASTYRAPLELAYWWGPNFNDDLLAIPENITRHQADDRQRRFFGVLWTEFWWHAQNDLKTLECEEVADIPSLGVGRETYGCRYVHSIVDPTAGVPNHLDGAVRLYSEEHMVERLGQNMYQAGRRTAYTKLWRVDGPISIPRWKEAITHHFRDNELVGEYLGGVDENPHLRPTIVSPPADPIASFIPCNMLAGQGVRFSLSYHALRDAPIAPVQIEAFDQNGTDEERNWYVEDDTLEIVKVLRQSGVSVSIPGDIRRLAFEDLSINLGMILHSGEDAVANAERTLDAIAALCNAWVTHGDDRVITCSIGIAYPDRVVYLSIAGHVVDLHAFLEQRPRLNATVGDLAHWLSSAYDVMNRLFPPAADDPPLWKMLQSTGILTFERIPIDWSYCSLEPNPQSRTPWLLVDQSRAPGGLPELARTGRLTFVEAFWIDEARCSRCGTDYAACPCSKYLDGVTQEIVRAPVCGMFWSNRPAARRVVTEFDVE